MRRMLLGLLLTPVLVYGQATEGTILGSIQDNSGAPVPNAGVSVTSEGTGATRQTITNQLGEYVRGYSGAGAAVVKQSGLCVKAVWRGSGAMSFANTQFRVRIRFTGSEAAQARFYAAYIE